MMRPNLRLLLFFTSILLSAGLAEAAPPNTNPGNDENVGSPAFKPPPKIQEYQSLGFDRRLATLSGIVLDLNDRPLSGVQVKLFIDGQLAATAATDAAGHYDIQSAYDPGADVTALLWFVAPDRSLMPKELVLRESKGSRENALISPCVPRADLLPGRQFRVYLFDLPSRNKELAELNCLP